MKYFIVLALVAVAAVQAALSPATKAKYTAAHNACQEHPETKISDAIYEKMKEGIFVNEPIVKEHMFCWAKHVHHMTESGDINLEAVRAVLLEEKSPEAVEKIVEKCAIKKSSPSETAYEMYKCWQANKIIYH